MTADVLLPVLGVLTILLPALAWRAGRLKRPGLLWICEFVSIAMVYCVRYANNLMSDSQPPIMLFLTAYGTNQKPGVWTALHGHYSTHTAVAISFGVTLVASRISMLPAVAAMVGCYLWLITYLPYHAPVDALSTVAVILPLSLLCHLPWWRRAG